MADGVFNIAKGRTAEFYRTVDEQNGASASKLGVVLLKVAETEDTLNNYDTLSALLAGSNTEANFTNYARVWWDQTNLTSPSPDDTNNVVEYDIPNPQWTSAGGALNNTLAKLLVVYDPLGTNVDTNIIPLTYHDYSVTTDGTTLTAIVDASGFYRAT
jgi:hypothetical protein